MQEVHKLQTFKETGTQEDQLSGKALLENRQSHYPIMRGLGGSWISRII